jgi:hypothetical protein
MLSALPSGICAECGLADKLQQLGRTMSIMFKIPQNTIHRFSLAEILLMAAMNEIEARQRAAATRSNPEGFTDSSR